MPVKFAWSWGFWIATNIIGGVADRITENGFLQSLASHMAAVFE